MDTSTHDICVPIDASQLAEMRQRIDRICSEHDVSPATTRRMVLATDEALSNIIEHGAVEDGGKIEVRVEISSREITVVVRDPGSPFDPCEVASPPNRQAFPKRGFGLYLIQMIADDVEYQRTSEGINVLTMTKSLEVVEETQGERK